MSSERMEEFEKWLRTTCFQKPTPEAYDLAKIAWRMATELERDACADLVDGFPVGTMRASDRQLIAKAIRTR